MKIVQIQPGFGGSFYCQTCLRDYALLAELKKQGHEVLMAPMYLPMFRDEKSEFTKLF